MEGALKYALGYYDAVITHLKEEDEIPMCKESIKELIKQIVEESSLFEGAVFEVGIDLLADSILKGKDYE